MVDKRDKNSEKSGAGAAGSGGSGTRSSGSYSGNTELSPLEDQIPESLEDLCHLNHLKACFLSVFPSSTFRLLERWSEFRSKLFNCCPFLYDLPSSCRKNKEISFVREMCARGSSRVALGMRVCYTPIIQRLVVLYLRLHTKTDLIGKITYRVNRT